MVICIQVEQEESQVQLPGGSPRWSPGQIKEIVGISGVYNCFGLADHLNRRGLYRSLFDRIMSIDGVPQLKLFSPIYCIKVGCAMTYSAGLDLNMFHIILWGHLSTAS